MREQAYKTLLGSRHPGSNQGSDFTQVHGFLCLASWNQGAATDLHGPPPCSLGAPTHDPRPPHGGAAPLSCAAAQHCVHAAGSAGGRRARARLLQAWGAVCHTPPSSGSSAINPQSAHALGPHWADHSQQSLN